MKERVSADALTFDVDARRPRRESTLKGLA